MQIPRRLTNIDGVYDAAEAAPLQNTLELTCFRILGDRALSRHGEKSIFQLPLKPWAFKSD
jgi:hypothetical protein